MMTRLSAAPRESRGPSVFGLTGEDPAWIRAALPLPRPDSRQAFRTRGIKAARSVYRSEGDGLS